MKRSKKVLIPRLRKVSFSSAKPLSVAIVSMIAAGCSFKEKAYIFKTVDECSASPKFSNSQCQVAYKKALKEAQKTAPRYKSLIDCEFEFGQNQCEMHPVSTSSYIPKMTGFMINEEAFRNNSSHGYNPLFSYYGRGFNRHRDPVWTTADGDRVAKGNKKTASVGKSAFKQKPAVTRTISRGGFGSTASAKSSWGGSSRGGWGG